MGTEQQTQTRVLDGVAMAAEIKQEVGVEVAGLRDRGIQPGLAVILVGELPASAIYVRNKVRACEELGIRSELLTPPESVTTEELLAMVAELNGRDEIDGILIQLPLPAHVDKQRLLEAVLPDKDVDGFHPVNAGRLLTGQPGLAPCTPAGVLEMLRRAEIPTKGRHAVVVGRSSIVGKPMGIMLVHASATVTICHRYTVDLARYTRQAEILVVAVGKPGLITPEMVQPGAVMVDVGINRLTDAAEVERLFPGDLARREMLERRGSTLVGDIEPAAFALASAYTPVPGGVGALTIAMLMHNTVLAARLRRGLLPAMRAGR